MKTMGINCIQYTGANFEEIKQLAKADEEITKMLDFDGRPYGPIWIKKGDNAQLLPVGGYVIRIRTGELMAVKQELVENVINNLLALVKY